MSVAMAAAIGVLLGIITGMPLAPINVAVVEAAAAGHRRYAIGVGAGGAIADAIHAALASLGLAALVTARPDLVRPLAAVTAIIVIAYGIVMWRRRARPRAAVDASSLARGIVTGFSITLPNPAALAAWVVVAAAVWPEPTTAESIALALGVGAGSTMWFAVLATWISNVRPDHPWLKIIPKAAVIAFVVVVAIGLVRILS